MAIHHVAFATADLAATHGFYTDQMGFRLAKTVVAPAPEGGWARHVFYDTAPSERSTGTATIGQPESPPGAQGGMIAFWELHLPSVPEVRTAISTDLGLPEWVNHLAFDAPTITDFEHARTRWLEHGHDVIEVDHGFCMSIYVVDPNGILVEWCHDTRPLDAVDAAEAAELLVAQDPQPEGFPAAVVHRAADHR